MWEGAGDRTETAIFWLPLLWPSTLCLYRSPDAQPEVLGPHSAGFLYYVLFSNFSGPQTPSGFPRAPLAGCGFPYDISSITRPISNCNSWLLSWLSYIIVQRPLSRLLDLWNRMFDHQAEITVMQFTGHSLPVHQSMSVPGEFFFYLVPFRQPSSAHTISSPNCH